MAFSLDKPKFIEHNLNKKLPESPETEKEFVKSIPSNSSFSNIEQKSNESIFPWNNPMVRDDVLKLFNIRLPEKDWLKLKFISDHTNKSMHQICLDYLIGGINKESKKIIREISEKGHTDNQET